MTATVISRNLAEEGLPPGALVGRFVVDRPLGRGPRGPSYRGHAVDTPREVVLKLVTLPLIEGDEWLTTAFFQMFVEPEEFRFPGVATVLDCSLDVSEVPGRIIPWVAAAWLDGVNLSTHLAGEPPRSLPATAETARVAEAITGLCRLLAPMHQGRMYHGNLAPSKILVDTAAAPAVMSVLDAWFPGPFLPRDEGDDLPADAVFTFGEYLPPEVILDGAEAAAEADVWAIGAMAFEGLTGQKLWDPRGLTVRQFRERVSAATRPSLQMLEEPAVQAVLSQFSLPLHALEVDPGKRPRSAGALLERCRADSAA